jgi:hypothetical protein
MSHSSTGPLRGLFQWLKSHFRQRGLIDTDRPAKKREADISYGICVGLVARWIMLHARFRGEDEHFRAKMLITSDKELAILAQVAFVKAVKGPVTDGGLPAIIVALKEAKVTLKVISPRALVVNVTGARIERVRDVLISQVSSQAIYYIIVIFFGDDFSDAHAIAVYHETSSAGGMLRIFEPNFGEFVVPYMKFGEFWAELQAEYLKYRDRAGETRRKRMTMLAVHTLQL